MCCWITGENRGGTEMKSLQNQQRWRGREERQASRRNGYRCSCWVGNKTWSHQINSTTNSTKNSTGNLLQKRNFFGGFRYYFETICGTGNSTRNSTKIILQQNGPTELRGRLSSLKQHNPTHNTWPPFSLFLHHNNCIPTSICCSPICHAPSLKMPRQDKSLMARFWLARLGRLMTTQ